jgi:hypothetical protein
MANQNLLFVYVSLFCLCIPVRAQPSREGLDRVFSSQTPLQADLLAPIDAAKVKRGTTILAKARVDWNNSACHLRVGSIVIGHVIDLEQPSKQNKGSSLTIAFDHAECEGSVTPFSFTLFAIIAYPKLDEGVPMVSTADVYGRSGMTTGHGGVPMQGPASLGMDSDMLARRGETKDVTPATIESGQIVGLKKVRLSVAAGPDGASVLSSLKDNLRFEGATQLVLMPRAIVAPLPQLAVADESNSPTSLTSSPTSPSLSAPAPVVTPVIAPEIDETGICTAPCALVPDAAGPVPARASLSTTMLGYVPHDRREYAAFDFESTLNFLDAHNLLFTYDPHKLRQRIRDSFSSESIHTVRAVLLDPATLKIKRILDWQIQGEGQYIWHTGPGQILVHLGHDLRLLDPNLVVLRKITLASQLAFVASSPPATALPLGLCMNDTLAPCTTNSSKASKLNPKRTLTCRSSMEISESSLPSGEAHPSPTCAL